MPPSALAIRFPGGAMTTRRSTFVRFRSCRTVLTSLFLVAAWVGFAHPSAEAIALLDARVAVQGPLGLAPEAPSLPV